jgi:hypothetical protein
LKKLILRNNTINRQHLSLPIWRKPITILIATMKITFLTFQIKYNRKLVFSKLLLICAFTPLLKPHVLIDLEFFVEKLYYILAEVYERRCKPNT